MSATSYQIRLCSSCGLRYPLYRGQTFGERCPVCLGSTVAIATHPLRTENRVALDEPSTHLEALLDNIRSAWNVGSIFRTANGFGLKHLHLCGITPTPTMEALKKTSLNAEETVAWTYHKNAVLAAQEMKRGGYKVFALEEDKHAIPIQKAKEEIGDEKVMLIAGNEVTGVDPELLELCDSVLYIPMRGDKKSFNVAVAFAVAVSQMVFRDPLA